MDLSCLDSGELFSLTLWRSEKGWTAGVQRCAGDQVRYECREKASEAVAALLAARVPKLPY